MNEIILVTGLPRSGTSLLMAMLQAGGVTLCSDGQRAPDLHNPRGYFEHRAVLTLAQESAWLEQLGGQAVKVLSRQLEHVAPELPARVLLLDRNLTEVAASQQRMLGSDSPDWDWPALLAKEFQRLQGVLARRRWPVATVSHQRLLRQPLEMAEEIQSFLGRTLDLPAMVNQVDLELYRNRSC
jgi:hypothetical protein